VTVPFASPAEDDEGGEEGVEEEEGEEGAEDEEGKEDEEGAEDEGEAGFTCWEGEEPAGPGIIV
jgi:hypothetical protein